MSKGLYRLVIFMAVVLGFLSINNLITVERERKEIINKNLIIEELVEIYDSKVYTYTIEELPNAQEHIKYACIVKFYDGEHYTERIMSVSENNFVYTEIVIEDKEFN